MLKWLLIVAGCLLIATVAVYGYMYLGERAPSADELARMALSGRTTEEKVQAALRLADMGASALPQIRSVLQETNITDIRAAMVQALGAAYDFESMPRLIEALEDPDLMVRQRADVAVTQILGADFFFLDGPGTPEQNRIGPDSPRETRAIAIHKVRQAYEAMLKNPPPKYRRTG